MKKNHFPRVLQRLLMLVVVMMFAICANAATLAEAQACYDEVTAVGAKVDDAAHNANYNALKALIDANSTDEAALQTAVDNCYRQYYYDQLAAAVLIYTNDLKKFVQDLEGSTKDDNDKATLQAALDAAAAVYGDAIDTAKTPADYKNALDALNAAYAQVLQDQYDAAKEVLDAQITTSTTTEGSLVYDENKDDLDDAITDAQNTESTATVDKTGINDLRNATTTLAGETTTVVSADAADAKNALATAINEATTYNDNTVSVVSDVVSNALASAIADAQAVKDNASATAQDAKDAADALNTAKATAETDLAAFQAAKTALNDAIDAAKAVNYSYTGVSEYLADAIAAAQAVADAAKAKTTAELTDAKTVLDAAVATAAATNAAANTLAGDITIAQDLVTKMDDATNIAAANAAIAAAQTALTEKANGATELATADQALKDAVKGYYESNLTATTTALTNKITEAQDALNNTIAYTTDAHATALSDAITAAQAVLTGISTPADMTAATTTLNTAITTNVEADAQEAIDALTTAISTAQTQYAQRYITNQIYAEPLNTYVTEAQAVLASGTAKERKAKAEEYTTVNKSVTTNINSFLSACNTLNSTITKAKNYRDNNTKSTHVGVIEYLNDAIAVAENIVDINNTPVVSATMTTQEIKDANTTLKNAYKTCAPTANGYANSIEANVTSATDLINNTLVDDSYKTTLQNAIDAANASLLAKADAENNGAGLLTALNNLQSAMYDCVSDDIADALKDLNDAITAANTTKATLGYDDPNGTTLQTAIDAASAVAADATKTAKELVDATTALNTAKDDVVAKDLQEATDALATALTNAKAVETSMNALSDKIDAKYADEKAAFNTAVVNDLTTAIKNAQDVQDADPASTGAAKVEQVAKLADAVDAANAALTLYYNTELQKLADEYTADKNLSATVSAEVTALKEQADFETEFTKAEEVYVSVKSGEDTYDAGDIIAARLALADAAKTLKDAKAAWDKAVADLEGEIVAANTELAAIQLPAHQDIYDTLAAAIAAANTVDANKSATATADLVTAYETLKAAVEAATYDDLHWDFADATPDYKEGAYAAGNVTYTRSGSYVAAGKFGSFCLPVAVATSNFKNVYVPSPFAIYNEDTKEFKVFFKKETADVIAANTPFLAEFTDATDGEVVLKSVADEIVAAAPATVPTQNIDLYIQTGTNAFVTLNTDAKLTWGGTLKKTTTVTGDLTFGSNGTLYKAGSYVSPFRAYMHAENLPQNAKFNVTFDEDDEATGIADLIMNAEGTNGKVYSVDGKYVGENVNGLAKGMYIVNGKKIVK